MGNLKAIIKNNPLTYAVASSFKKATIALIRLLNSVLIKPLGINSKYLGSPKNEVGGLKGLEKYIEQKRASGNEKYQLWKLYAQKITIPEPVLTVGTPSPGSEVSGREFNYCEYFLRIPNGRLYYKDYAVVTEDDTLLNAVSNWYGNSPKSHLIFNQLKLPKVTHLKGKTCILKGGNGYYHVMIDCVPTLKMAEDAGLKVDDFDHFIITHYNPVWYDQVWKHFNIPLEKIVPLDETNTALECEEMYFSTYFDKQGTWYGNYLYQKLHKPVSHTYPEKIYVSRAKTKVRRVLNEPDVIDLLTKYGFAVIYNEDYSIGEQMAIYRKARYIISPHGANLVNYIACEPGAKVCEIRYTKHSRYHKKTYYEMAVNFGLEYYLLYCNDGKISQDHVKIDEVESDLFIDLADLKQILEGMGLRPLHA